MAQTKRKRRTKHRGNAVGVVEARGRTSKPREGAPRSTTGRAAARPAKPPTLKSAALKALVGIAILFVFFSLTSRGTTMAQTVTMCFIAFVLYTPLMYITDKWIYRRKLKLQAGGGARR